MFKDEINQSTNKENKMKQDIKNDHINFNFVATMVENLTSSYLNKKGYDQISANLSKDDSNIINYSKRKVISVTELLKETGRMHMLRTIASEDNALNELLPRILGSGIIVRWSSEDGYSIGNNKFKNHKLLVKFLADINNIIGLFYKKKTLTIQEYILNKFVDKISTEHNEVINSYRFRLFDFLRQTGMMETFQNDLNVLLKNVPNMCIFNSVPEDIVLKVTYSTDTYPVGKPHDYAVYGCYNDQTEVLSLIKVFNKDIKEAYEFLSTPINLVKKIDSNGNFINEQSLFRKQTPPVNKDIIDTTLLSFISSHPFIPLENNCSYVRINIKDLVIYMNSKCNTSLAYINNKENLNGPFDFKFVVCKTMREEYKLCRGDNDQTVIGWSTSTRSIISFLASTYLKTN